MIEFYYCPQLEISKKTLAPKKMRPWRGPLGPAGQASSGMGKGAPLLRPRKTAPPALPLLPKPSKIIITSFTHHASQALSVEPKTSGMPSASFSRCCAAAAARISEEEPSRGPICARWQQRKAARAAPRTFFGAPARRVTTRIWRRAPVQRGGAQRAAYKGSSAPRSSDRARLCFSRNGRAPNNDLTISLLRRAKITPAA